jgi:hypothetical protein
MSILDVPRSLKRPMGGLAKRVPTLQMPNWLVRLPRWVIRRHGKSCLSLAK